MLCTVVQLGNVPDDVNAEGVAMSSCCAATASSSFQILRCFGFRRVPQAAAETVALPDATVVAKLRLTTNPRMIVVYLYQCIRFDGAMAVAIAASAGLAMSGAAAAAQSATSAVSQ